MIYRFYHFFEIKIMTMNNVFNLSGDASRIFAIDIAGSPNQAMMRSSAYTVKVPYSSLAQTIHSIGKRGGKVIDVRMLSVSTPGVENLPKASAVAPVKAVAPQPTKAAENPKGESQRPPSKSKKR
jgi:phycocyanin-associated, rod